MNHSQCLLAGSLKEIHAFLGNIKDLESFRSAEFTISSRFGVNNIYTEEITRQRVKSGVCYMLLFYTLCSTPLFHFIINIRDTYENESLIILHPGYLHICIGR